MTPANLQFFAIKAMLYEWMPFSIIAKHCRTDVMTVARVAGDVATYEYRLLMARGLR